MTTFKLVVSGAIGILSCHALVYVAARLTVRWQRAVILVVALIGLLSQGYFWGGVTRTLKGFDVGGSYFWLYAALVASVVGMVWALVLLGATLFRRRLTD
jgi:hypothetical protein